MDPIREIGGYQVHLWEAGQGPAVLFLYDAWHASPGFEPLSFLLREHHHTLAIDPPALGESPTPPDLTLTVPEYAKWVAEAVKHAGARDVTLVLCDLGLPLGMACLAKEPAVRERIAGVVILNGLLYGDQGGGHLLLRRGPFLSKWERWMGRMEHRRRILELYGDPERMDEEAAVRGWQAIQRGSLQTLARVGKEVQEADSELALWRKALEESAVPVLVLWGEEDPTGGRKVADKFQKEFPDAEMYALPDVGHFPHLEAPAVLAEEIAGFVSRNRNRNRT